MHFAPIDILQKAQREGYAVGQFNAASLEVLHAIARAALELKSPVIIGTSEGERNFAGVRELVAIVRILRETLELPVILNADHTKSLEKVREAVDAGYDAVHFDGSDLALEENVKQTAEAVRIAKKKSQKILVEGELGYIRGSSELHREKVELRPEDFTDPRLAERFVKETGVDSLAISIGSFHGMSSGVDPGAEERLDLKRLARIREATNAFLVLHGASGVLPGDIQGAVRNGIVKININTELRIAFAGALHEQLHAHPDTTTPYKMYAPAMDLVKAAVREKISQFGSVGKA